MVQSKSPGEQVTTDPAQLPAAERDYYRVAWGFDPVSDCRSIEGGGWRYEACSPLAHDPPLEAVRVTLCARVDWHEDMVHNSIVFQRDQREAAVECTHTMVYAGPASRALTFAKDTYTTDDRITGADLEWMKRSGGPLLLPPWEHFAALKSYVGAIAELGIAAMFRATFPRDGEDILDTPEAPFGFNSAMQAQVLRALDVVAHEATKNLRRDLARELQDTAPIEWILRRWEILNPIYPLRDVFSADPDFFVASLRTWVGEDPFKTLSTFTGRAQKDLGDLLLQEWVRVLRMWPPALLISVFRSSDLLDGIQEHLFNSTNLARAKTEAPTIPWDQLQVEWRARREAQAFIFNLKFHGSVNKYRDFPPGEVWPRVPVFAKELPKNIFREEETGSVLAVRQARVHQFLGEAIQHYESILDDENGDIKWMARWARRSHETLSSDLVKPFSIEWKNPHPRFPRDNETLQNWVLGANASQRRAAALSPNLSLDLQERLGRHWDFATRLALAANPNINSFILNILAKDVQLCIRTLVQTRQLYKSPELYPLKGEILSPGAILWLLVANAGTWFFFGITTYGDGSVEYATWVQNQINTHAPGLKDHVGEAFAWVYREGAILQDTPRNTRGFDAHHLALEGFTRYACNWLPCIFLQAGPEMDSGIGSPFNVWYDKKI